MKNTFAAALVAGLSLSAPAMADETTNMCASLQGLHDFTLTFNDVTRDARLQGSVELPSLAHGYDFEQLIAITTHKGKLFELSVTPPQSDIMGGTMVTDATVDESFNVESDKSHVGVIIKDSQGRIKDSIICPVPK